MSFEGRIGVVRQNPGDALQAEGSSVCEDTCTRLVNIFQIIPRSLVYRTEVGAQGKGLESRLGGMQRL